MLLRDHFHPPLSERRPWDSFHSAWCNSIADLLNRDLLPQTYIALPHAHHGPAIEIDVGACEEGAAEPGGTGPTATLLRTVWLPATPPVTLPAAYPERFTVEIHSTEGGRTLVAAIELVSPGNKDRETKKRLFTAKCAAYLARGVGLVVLDVVTSRLANLHNDLLDLLDARSAERMPDRGLYAVGYRPLTEKGEGRIDCWPFDLAVGQSLPTVPLSLAAEWCVGLDLDATYADACKRQRISGAA